MDIQSVVLILQHAEQLGETWVGYVLVFATIGLFIWNMWQRSNDVNKQKEELKSMINVVTESRDHIAIELTRTRDILNACQTEQAALNKEVVKLQKELTRCNQRVFKLMNERLNVPDEE